MDRPVGPCERRSDHAATGTNPALYTDEVFRWNSRASHAAEIASANAIGTARSIARLYGCLARGGELDGVRIFSEASVRIGRGEL